jgi:hypothetical protein
MIRTIFVAVLSALLASAVSIVFSQGGTYTPGSAFSVLPTLPATCSTPNIVILSGATPSINLCTSTNVFTIIGGSTPSGQISFILSGTCPTGYTQVTELDGKVLIGTLAANSNIGTTGGNDNITPSGTNSALTFTGSSATSSAVSAGTPIGTNATGTVTPLGTVAAPVFTGSALGTHTHTVTATGTINTPVFTGNSFDNRSAFIRLIACSKS